MNVAGALARRIRMLIARSVVNLIYDDLEMQGLQVSIMDGEVAKMERFQNFGFTSVPFEGAEALLAAVAGVRSHLVAVAVDDRRYRKKDLQAGEVAMYNKDGDYILLKDGRIVEVVAGAKLTVNAPEVVVTASSKVTFDTPELHCTGKITADGDISSTSDVLGGPAAISLVHHIHIAPQGPTSPPQ